jgi:tetratricopeptide (TPR) repeat protein
MAIQIWQPGDKIKNDRFHIIKHLGTGGFGITYLAEDTVKKQQIVIKTLNANQQSQADFAQKQENFVREGFTLTKFKHPHIVKVHEPIQIGELWGLVMEYIPGQDLADYIIANGRLGEAEALNYIDQIAQALDCVHEQKFFHRDVKPHNIMLRQDRGEAVLIDFGIAKEFVDLETIYLSNSLGTELYKPIEQYEKRGQFGAYTDIYALAVTLYHLLTGAAPGGGSPLYTSKARKDAQDKGWGANLDEHLWGELANAGVSERTQAAIKAGMEIEANQRPQSIAVFRELIGSLKKEKTNRENKSEPNENWFEDGNKLLYLLKHEDALSRDEWIMRGDTLYRLKKYEEALSSYDRALKIDPNYSEAWSDRGITLFRLEKYEEALSSYDRALKIDPNDNYKWIMRGDTLYMLKKHEEALSSYDRALKIGTGYGAYGSRGFVLQTLKEYEKSIISYDYALKLEPDNYKYWCARGDSLEKLGKYEEAIDSYYRSLEICPNSMITLSRYSNSLVKSGRYEEAINSYDRRIKIDPDNFTLWSGRGDSLERLGKYEEAIDSYDRVLKLDPSESFHWYRHGCLLEKSGKYKESIDSYNQALKIDPDYIKASKNRQIVIDKLAKPTTSWFSRIFS